MRVVLWASILLIVLFMLAIATPGTAWKASKIGLKIGDFTFGNETAVQKPSASLFHRESLASSDTGTLAISFPTTAGSAAGLPAITQTSDATTAGTETGFFTANWCYTALSNVGGYALTPDAGSWHPMKSSAPVGAGMAWPYMYNTESGAKAMKFKPALNVTPAITGIDLPGHKLLNNSETAGSGTPAARLANNTSAWNVTSVNKSGSSGTPAARPANNTSAGNVTSVNKSGGSGTPNRDYKNMSTGDIRNMSGLEKLYRNANMVNRIPQSYKGTVDRPTVIAPMEHPMDIIKPANKTQVIGDAANMTRSGSNLKTQFWDL